MADAASGDALTGWVQIGTIIGSAFAATLIAIWGRRGEASPAISQTRAEATEIWRNELSANRDVFQAMRQAAEATRDAAVSTDRSLSAMREQINRLITCQEAIVKMMEKEADDERSLERTKRQLIELMDKERADAAEARVRERWKSPPD